jgi:hypothetical protein
MHCGEKDVVVKGLNEIGDRPGLYRRVSHRVVVVRRTNDDACLGRDSLQLRLDLETAHLCHPDIKDRKSHKIVANIRKKTERLTKQLRLQARG